MILCDKKKKKYYLLVEKVIVIELGQLLHLLYLPKFCCVIEHMQLGHVIAAVEVHPVVPRKQVHY